MYQQKNKVALITGASRGIGAATALLLAQNGYDICINYLNSKDKADEIIKQASSFGVKAFAIQADLAQEKEILKIFATIDQEFGKIDALVNNGGISGGRRSVTEIDFNYLEQIYRTNVFASFICCREALKRMKQGSAIVNISSLSAKSAGFKMSGYASTKAALNNFTVGCAREAAELGIRVNAVMPGVINTDTHNDITPERMQHLLSSIPLHRLGTPEEVAQTILWLLSEKSSYITGATVEITGGK